MADNGWIAWRETHRLEAERQARCIEENRDEIVKLKIDMALREGRRRGTTILLSIIFAAATAIATVLVAFAKLK